MLGTLIDVVIYLIIADAVLSWFMGPQDFPKSLTSSMLDPIYSPIRDRLGASRGGIDFSPILLIVGLSVVQACVG